MAQAGRHFLAVIIFSCSGLLCPDSHASRMPAFCWAPPCTLVRCGSVREPFRLAGLACSLTTLDGVSIDIFRNFPGFSRIRDPYKSQKNLLHKKVLEAVKTSPIYAIEIEAPIPPAKIGINQN
ncbi:hypothetical protein CIHG_09557 [Coccidioides immitis H538.4]|uniref:Uncharacterized protein n=1 Tax=Coccidioides immitis H538.4 TaxID=396776 RepID=A0A0J8S2W7_COCIT|nr:hypothetical protein CIHG_09557 [Coccidioides immitis H538.4]